MGAPLDDDEVVPPEELLETPPLDELLLEEPMVPDELPLPELPLLEPPGAAGGEPLEHPPARQRLAARSVTWAVVGFFFELSICIFSAPSSAQCFD